MLLLLLLLLLRLAFAFACLTCSYLKQKHSVITSQSHVPSAERHFRAQLFVCVNAQLFDLSDALHDLTLDRCFRIELIGKHSEGCT